MAGHRHERLMREGRRAVLQHASGMRRRHRLAAHIEPGKLASIARAASCGVVQEGDSPRDLEIGERWAIPADRKGAA